MPFAAGISHIQDSPRPEVARSVGVPLHRPVVLSPADACVQSQCVLVSQCAYSATSLAVSRFHHLRQLPENERFLVDREPASYTVSRSCVQWWSTTRPTCSASCLQSPHQSADTAVSLIDW